MTVRLSQEYVAEQFASRGCSLLGEYKEKSKPVAFVCKCGKESTITYSSLRGGSYCMDCGGKRKHTTDEIAELARSRGCELLSEYKDSHSKVKIKCKCGVIYETVWSNFRDGRECLSCGRGRTIQSASGSNHYAWIEDREEARLRRSITVRCNLQLHRVFKKLGKSKPSRSEKLLGYTRQELREHLQSHPNWNSVKDGDWQIDHVFPVKAFLDYGIQDASLINCLENLRPLPKRENLKKQAKYNKVEFEAWLKSKGR
jgi:hypothetical protein